MGILRKSKGKAAQLIPQPGNPLPAITLSASGANVLGRKGEGPLAINDPNLSRQHTTIWLHEGQWWVRDEQSLNGTFIEGERIETASLELGGLINLGGNLEFRLEQISGETEEAEGEMTETSSTLAGIFCLGLAPTQGGATIPLRRGLTIVGRNKTSDIVLDEPQVSGIHARIRQVGAQINLLDSGSRNGTVVNGETVRRAVLKPGDEVTFGGSSFTVKQTLWPTATMWTGMGAIALVLILAVLVPALLRSGTENVDRLWTKDMYLAQVSESLVLAVRAFDNQPRNIDVARAQFAVAQRSLVAADLLPLNDLSENDLAEAFTQATTDHRVSRELGDRDIFALYQSLDDPPPHPVVNNPGPSEPVIEQSAEQSAEQPIEPASPVPAFNLDQELSRLVAQFGIDTRRRPIPEEMRTEVAHFIDFWTGPRRGFTERTMKRSEPYLEMIREQMHQHQLPEVFAYLPFIESGYRESVTSTAKARGLWQFMPSTGRNHGLRVDDEIDERTDPRKSTEAACQYIESLLNMFGPNAFLCAVAAYNKGENGMARCLKKYGDWHSTWKFWDVVENGNGCLKPETVEYVPRFLAAAVVMRNPKEFGFSMD